MTDSLAARPGRPLRPGADQSALRQEELASRSSARKARSREETDTVERDDFWATTSNKQLNFVQHVKTLLKHQRPRRRGRARQRALRGRGRGDRAPEAPPRVRRPHAAAPAHRHLLRPGREGERAVLRQEARQRDAVDEAALDLRPAHQHALHPEDQPAEARGPRRVRRLLPAGEPPRPQAHLVRRDPRRPLARLRLRRPHQPATRPASTSSGSGTRAWRTPTTSRPRVSSPPRSSRTWRPRWSSSGRLRRIWESRARNSCQERRAFRPQRGRR